MKITIEHKGKRYEVVPCGRRCSFALPGVDCNGHADFCVNRCHTPRWWRQMLITDMAKRDYSGLKEVTK